MRKRAKCYLVCPKRAEANFFLKTTIQKFEKPMGDALNFLIEFDLESYLRCTIIGLVWVFGAWVWLGSSKMITSQSFKDYKTNLKLGKLCIWS